MINHKSKIFLTGHKGLVGSSILRRLKFFGYKNIICKSKKSLDLRDQKKVNNFLKKNKPEAIINAAATVGGIEANNKNGAKFIYNNLSIQNNIIHLGFINGIKNIVFLGSSCIYPKFSKQPIKEEYLLDGKLEKSNEAYAIAKIAGVKMCEYYNKQYGTNFKCLMPCNTYGPNDNYDLSSSHFFPALIKKIHDAKIKKNKNIVIWGSGKPKRELIYVDDVADACIYFLKRKTKDTIINIGSGKEKKIIDYAKFIINELNINLKIIFDKSKLDGTPRKLLDSKISHRYGWKTKISLREGFKRTYKDYLNKNS